MGGNFWQRTLRSVVLGDLGESVNRMQVHPLAGGLVGLIHLSSPMYKKSLQCCDLDRNFDPTGV